jgi:hypothetical protein
MCNLYSMSKNQAAIIAIARALRDITGNLPILPGIFPDYMAPEAHPRVVRHFLTNGEVSCLGNLGSKWEFSTFSSAASNGGANKDEQSSRPHGCAWMASRIPSFA